MKQSGFFDVEERLARLSGLGDQLEAFSRTVDFEMFRPDLDQALAYSDGYEPLRDWRRPIHLRRRSDEQFCEEVFS